VVGGEWNGKGADKGVISELSVRWRVLSEN
jgi:hypothetical protein